MQHLITEKDYISWLKANHRHKYYALVRARSGMYGMAVICGFLLTFSISIGLLWLLIVAVCIATLSAAVGIPIVNKRVAQINALRAEFVSHAESKYWRALTAVYIEKYKSQGLNQLQAEKLACAEVNLDKRLGDAPKLPEGTKLQL